MVFLGAEGKLNDQVHWACYLYFIWLAKLRVIYNVFMWYEHNEVRFSYYNIKGLMYLRWQQIYQKWLKKMPSDAVYDRHMLTTYF